MKYYNIGLLYSNGNYPASQAGYPWTHIELNKDDVVIYIKIKKIKYVIPIESIYSISLIRSPVFLGITRCIRIYHTAYGVPPLLLIARPPLKIKSLYKELLKYKLPKSQLIPKYWDKPMILTYCLSFLMLLFLIFCLILFNVQGA